MSVKNWQGEMRRLEDAVQKSDGEGLRARWESGRYMLALRKGKQLPPGVLGELATNLDVHRSELTARMKFASKFPSEAKVTKAISKFRTWYEIKQNALTDKPRPKDGATAKDDRDLQPSTRSLRRVLEIVKDLDAATFDERDQRLLVKIEASILRLKTAAGYLKEAA